MEEETEEHIYFDTLKERINEFLYLNLHGGTTLKEMEDLACDFHSKMSCMYKKKQIKFTVTTTESNTGNINEYQSAKIP